MIIYFYDHNVFAVNIFFTVIVIIFFNFHA